MSSIYDCSTPSDAHRTPQCRNWRPRSVSPAAPSRIDRLEREGVVTGYGPDIDVIRAGLSVLAFTMLEISQGSHDSTISSLVDIHEIVEIHTITGQGDLLCRIVARSNDHLHEVLQRIAQIETVMRSQTQLALSTPHQRGVLDALLALPG